jgi:F-type H+-transporting ATPase subunit epsilon
VARLEVHVVSPEANVYTGDGDMVVARGTDGMVGIMPGHAPMLIELAVAPVRVFDGTTERDKILVDGGFLHVTPGEEVTRVDVLAESAELPAGVDAATARRRVEELRGSAGDEDHRARTELARWEMRAEHGAA